MRILFFLLLNISAFSQQGVLGYIRTSETPTSYQQLEAFTLSRYVGSPIASISYQAETWKGRQVHYPMVIENPNNPDSLIMFYGGGSVYNQDYSIGRAVASKENPFSWTDYGSNPVINYTNYGNGPILGPQHLRYNTAANRFEMWACTYNTALNTSWQGRYHSLDGFTWTYQGSALIASGDETYLGNCAIIEEGSTWYMYYTYRVGADVLPGIRVAISTNSGSTWTKLGNVLTRGASISDYDGKYVEDLQALKIGNDYVLIYGAAKEVAGLITFSVNYAHSKSPTSGFTKSSLNPIFEKSASGWDSTQVATLNFCTITTPWTFFYQGTNTPGDYGYALWSMGAGTLIRQQ